MFGVPPPPLAGQGHCQRECDEGRGAGSTSSAEAPETALHDFDQWPRQVVWGSAVDV